MSLKQPNNSVKVFIKIYVSPKTEYTKDLYQKIDTILNELNKRNIMIKFINVNSSNSDRLKKQNIVRTPTLVNGNIHKIGVTNILQYLISCVKRRETYGKGVASPDEMMANYQKNVLADGDNEEKTDLLDEAVVRKKMEEMQKKRPQMAGVVGPNKISGGKPIKVNRGKQSKKFSDDGAGEQEFIEASGINVVNTPAQKYEKSEDGDLTLEDYYLEEAEKQLGHKKTIKRRR